MDLDFEKGLEPPIGGPEMNENQKKNQDLVNTTDCLEAISVFKGWKNFLFIIILCCLLLLQALFWIVDLEIVKPDDQAQKQTRPVEQSRAVDMESPASASLAPETVKIQLPEDVNKINKAADEVAGEQNTPSTQQQVKKRRLVAAIKYKHIAWLIRFLDFVLALAAILYCLTLLFALKISLLGRLGGINHISRAFFLSLVFTVLLLPWQKLFGSAVKGAMFGPQELAAWVDWSSAQSGGIFIAALYYLRFTGYWLIVLLLLIFSMNRSIRWTKATLRRLEII